MQITIEERKQIEDTTGASLTFIENDDYYKKDCILFWLKGHSILKIDLPKKYNKEWVLNAIEKRSQSTYKNLTTLFSKIGIDRGIYYTSFGFSYMIWFQSKEKFKEEVEQMQEVLNKAGIKFRNEFSDAYWVYRFIISKEAENLNKIKCIA